MTVIYPTTTPTEEAFGAVAVIGGTHPGGGQVGIPFVFQADAGPGPGPGGGAVPRNVLIDRKTREVYPWPMNHSSEDSIKTLGRRLTRSGITASGKLLKTRKLFLVRNPSHPGPAHLILHGNFLDRDQAQYQTFVRFFNECDDRSFDYIDASGDSYHIVITQFDARRKGSYGREDGSFFEYSLEVEVISAQHGPYRGYVV